MSLLLAAVAGCGSSPVAPPEAPSDPIPAPAPLPEPAAPDPPLLEDEAIEEAIAAAVAFQHRWLDDPPSPPHADAAVAAHALATAVPGPQTERLVAKVTDALAGRTEPLQRLWDPSLELEATHTASWTPTPGERVNPNRLLVEAAYCADNGWRAQSTVYACGDMRDDGGFHTAHGAWALAMAVQRGCVQREDACLDALATELVEAAARDGRPTTTLEADLLAERILFGMQAGASADAVAPHVSTLLSVQADDGSFGTPEEDERPYWRYHAAMGGAWALATFRAAR